MCMGAFSILLHLLRIRALLNTRALYDDQAFIYQSMPPIRMLFKTMIDFRSGSETQVLQGDHALCRSLCVTALSHHLLFSRSSLLQRFH